jgi:hypothetical protein
VTTWPHLDAAYHTLPRDDGTPRYIGVEAANEEIAVLSLRVLHLSAWHRHRVGRAVYAHCANGARWIIGLAIGGERPPWWDRLGARHGG